MTQDLRNPYLIHPGRLERLLAVVALASLVLILTLSGYGVYRVYSEQVIANAREDSIHISEVLWSQERDDFLLIAADGGQEVAAVGDMARLDRQLRRFLAPFGIVKIKVYNDSGLIVYSTDHSIIGRVDQNNLRLGRALQGDVDAKLEHKGTFLDLAEEEILDIDVVETYVPIRGDAGAVIGAFEVYIDVTKYRQQIQTGVQRTLAVLTGILLLVFLLSFFIVRKATRELQRAQITLSKMATTDALTGLFNRNHLMRRLQEESSRLKRVRETPPGPNLALIMLDIDHFKRVNDTYGHPAGDAVLQEVGRRLTEAKREYDVVGRYGGEEFLFALPGTDLVGARVVAERLRKAVRSQPFQVEGKELQVTVSLGLAVVQTGEENCEAALKRADEGLYAAKRAGRDCIGCEG